MRRAGLSGALLTAIAALVVAVVAPAGIAGTGADAAGKKKVSKIKVADDFFSPLDLTVKKRTTLKWIWQPGTSNPHNVTLTKAPKGLKKKQKKKLTSKCTGATCDPFKTKLTKPGTYKFVCTIHRTTMKQTTKVKK